MKLASYYGDGLKVGLVVEADVWDIRKAYELYLLEEEKDPQAAVLATSLVPSDMAAFIGLHSGGLGAIEDALSRLMDDQERYDWCRGRGLVHRLADVRLLQPVVRPSKIVNIGNAYREHIINSAKAKGLDPNTVEIPGEVKVSFLKTSSALTAPGDPVRYPKDSQKWDFEGELAIVIGRTCAQVALNDADRYIFGYTIFNDASIRDVPQVLGGTVSPTAKSADTTAPLGPWIVTREGFGLDPNKLSIKVHVNDEVRQDANTASMMWTVQEIVARTSQRITLFPGDIIATSSPPGVGSETGRFLNVGDVVRIEIEGIGILTNPVGSPR